MKRKNILVVTYWSFREPLIQTYTLPYIKLIQKELPKGSQVFLFTLEKKNIKVSTQEKYELIKQNIILVDSDYSRFGVKALFSMFIIFFRLSFLIFNKNIFSIHCWCTPGGAIGYILSKITGKRLILDSYEPHADAMVESNVWKKNSIAFKILFLLEKLQTRRAASIISATEGMRGYMKARYNEVKESFYVKPACVDFRKFDIKKSNNQDLIEKLGLSDKIIGVYAGKFGGIYLDREVFDLLKVASDIWGEKFHFLLLTNENPDTILKYAKASGFPEIQLTHMFVEHRYIADYLGIADFAITPVKPIPTKRYCTPIKNGEYWAMGLPVLSTKGISDDSDIIMTNQIGSIFEPNNFSSYTAAIKEIDELIKKKEQLTLKAVEIAEKYRSFKIAARIYQEIYGEA